MVQIYKDPKSGQEHEFPDDASPQEIDEATKNMNSNINRPNFPLGFEMGLGLMSMAFPENAQKTVANLPQYTSQVQPTRTEFISQELGKMLPGFETGSELAPKINPLKFSNKNIIKDILNTRSAMQDKYGNLYTDLWKEANKRGLGEELINKPEIDMFTLEKYTPNKKLDAVKDFLTENTLNNAHDAKSDLLAIQRELEKKSTFTKPERKQYKAVSDAIKNIQDNMFKTESGKVDEELLNKYKDIQKGYKEEVIPYKNSAINKYKAKEITDKELINALSKGSFAAKRGQFHLINKRESLTELLKNLGYGGFSLTGLGTLATGLNYLRNKSSEE